MIKSEEEALSKQYNVKKYPAFFILKHGEKKPFRYEGDSFTYKDLFEFINIYSETFVHPDTTNKDVESAASKPWLSQPIPYLSKESANDICLKKDGILCVIYVVKDAASSDDKIVQTLQSIQERFTSKLERGINFSYMRLDATAESEFAASFGLEDSQLPALVVLNPGKKKRFLHSEYGLEESGIAETLDKILGGDARFKMISGNKLPDLTQEHAVFLQ